MLSINLMRFDVMVYMFPSSTAQVYHHIEPHEIDGQHKLLLGP